MNKISYKYLTSLVFNLECESASAPQNSRRSGVRSVHKNKCIYFFHIFVFWKICSRFLEYFHLFSILKHAEKRGRE